MTDRTDDDRPRSQHEDEAPPTRVAELAQRLVEVTDGDREEAAVVDAATALRDELDSDTDALLDELDEALEVTGPQVDRDVDEQLTGFSNDAFGATMTRQPLIHVCDALREDFTRFDHEFIVERAASVTAFERDLAETRPGIEGTIQEARGAYTNNRGGDFVDRAAAAPSNQPVRLEVINVGKPTSHFVRGDVRLFEYQVASTGGPIARPVVVETTLDEVAGFEGGLVTEETVQRVASEMEQDGGDGGGTSTPGTSGPPEGGGTPDQGGMAPDANTGSGEQTRSEGDGASGDGNGTDRIGPDDASQSVTVEGGIDPFDPATVYLLIEAAEAEAASVRLRASVEGADERRLQSVEALSLSAVTESYERARLEAIEEHEPPDIDGGGGGDDGPNDTGGDDGDGSDDGIGLWPLGLGALGSAGAYAGYRYLFDDEDGAADGAASPGGGADAPSDGDGGRDGGEMGTGRDSGAEGGSGAGEDSN